MKMQDGLILIGVICIAWILYRAQRRDPEFDFFDLLKERNKVSRIACVVMGSWASMTYVFIGMYRDGKMTETVLLAYGGLCFAPLIAKMFAPPISKTTSSSTTTSSAETTEGILK
jgi:hypothetical protein